MGRGVTDMEHHNSIQAKNVINSKIAFSVCLEMAREFLGDMKPFIFIVFFGYFNYYIHYSSVLYIAFADITIKNCYFIYFPLVIVLYVLFKIAGFAEPGESAFLSSMLPYIIFVNLRAVKVSVFEIAVVLSLLTIKIIDAHKRIQMLGGRHRNSGFMKRLKKRMYFRRMKDVVKESVFFVTLFLFISFWGASFIPGLPEQINALKLFPAYTGIQSDNVRIKGESIGEVTTSRERMVLEHMDRLSVLSDSSYGDADVKAKMGALQQICNIECIYLGCSDIPVVISDDREDRKDGVLELGFYNRHTNEIWINPKALYDKKSYAAITITLHEIRHVYQHECIDKINLEELSEDANSLRMISDIRKWKEEMENYISCETNGTYGEYKGQCCEQDAESYGLENLKLYYNWINNVKTGEGDEE